MNTRIGSSRPSVPVWCRRFRFGCLALALTVLFVGDSPVWANLVALWDFEEGAGATTADTGAAPANTGILFGASFNSFAKRGAYSMYFSAASRHYVSIPNEPSLNPTSALSVAAWIYADGANPYTGNGRVLQKGANDDQYRLKYEDGKLRFDFNTVAGPRRAEAVLPIQNAWHHVVGVYDGMTASLYVDGALAYAFTYSPSNLVTTTDPLFIGNKLADGVDGWQGNLDDVRVYDEALTPEQVDALVFLPGTAKAVETVYNFEDAYNLEQAALTQNTGSFPTTRMTLGNDGNYYGTISLGVGSIYRLTPSGVYTKIVKFTDTTGDFKGHGPEAELLLASDGNFYGTTANGGRHGGGTVFKVTPGGLITTLAEFDYADPAYTEVGAEPIVGLTEGKDGNFYGATSRGGLNDDGAVFRMSPNGDITPLENFFGATSTLTLGADGSFYGTTNSAIFRITPGGSWQYDDLSAVIPGAFIYHSQLVLGSNGDLYGTTNSGGAGHAGVFFKFNSQTGLLTKLADFYYALGGPPRGGLRAGAAGGGPA